MSHSTDPTPPPAQPPSRQHRLIQRLRVFKARIRASTWRTMCRLGIHFSNGAAYTAGVFLVVGLVACCAGLPLREVLDVLKP
ncbi:hypothetical protein [Streptomyces angustmyceticus]|uniref:hypothetical protein n=1 Tax=Streptomyces angustmyceticus TaxID=285578 RepID=UPI003450F63F